MINFRIGGDSGIITKLKPADAREIIRHAVYWLAVRRGFIARTVDARFVHPRFQTREKDAATALANRGTATVCTSGYPRESSNVAASRWVRV